MNHLFPNKTRLRTHRNRHLEGKVKAYYLYFPKSHSFIYVRRVNSNIMLKMWFDLHTCNELHIFATCRIVICDTCIDNKPEFGKICKVNVASEAKIYIFWTWTCIFRSIGKYHKECIVLFSHMQNPLRYKKGCWSPSLWQTEGL